MTIEGRSTTLIALSDFVGNLGSPSLKPIEIVSSQVQPATKTGTRLTPELIQFTVRAAVNTPAQPTSVEEPSGRGRGRGARGGRAAGARGRQARPAKARPADPISRNGDRSSALADCHGMHRSARSSSWPGRVSARSGAGMQRPPEERPCRTARSSRP